MTQDDLADAMVERYAHAAEVCRVCAEFRSRVPYLSADAERAAVVLNLPIPALIAGLNRIEKERRACR